MFSSLKIREFRLYWFSMFVSLVGSWVQSMAQTWLIFSLTHSPFLMGLVGFLSYLPVSLFSLPAGVLVDRSVKRNLLLVTQSLFTILAFILAYLVLKHEVQVWHIIVIASLNGLVLTFDAPTRQAMVVELVGKQHVMNAIALNSASFNSARIIGPALAGILIAAIGMSGCFFINALSFLPVVLILCFIKPKPAISKSRMADFFQDIKESITLIKSSKFLLELLTIVGLVSTFGVSYVVLMPIFAQEILKSGILGLAILMSFSGMGALVGALNLARLSPTASKMKVLNTAVILFFVSVMIFSLSHSLALSAILLTFAGYGAASSMSMANTLLQITVPDAHRGRVMGIFMMMFMGFMPFGSIIFGSLAHFFGVQAVVFFGSIVSLAFYLWITRKYEK